MNRQDGFSMAEMLVSMTVLVLVFVGALGILNQAELITESSDSQSRIQGNVRLAADILEHDLRMIGFGVPTGQRVGSSADWLPVIMDARGTQIAFAAEIDGGAASVTCTPSSSNFQCPRNRLRLDSVAHYVDLNCKRADDGSVGTPLVVVNDFDSWQPTTCSTVNSGNRYLTLGGNLDNGTFTAGNSYVYTIEQVYYRYTAGTTAPYGRLERAVRYANLPDTSYPNTGWVTIADHLTDFDLGYLDASGSVISTGTLSSAQRGNVRRVVITLQGFDAVGARGGSQLIELQSEVLVRNMNL